MAAPDVCDGTSAVGESRHRIPRRIRWSTEAQSHFCPRCPLQSYTSYPSNLTSEHARTLSPSTPPIFSAMARPRCVLQLAHLRPVDACRATKSRTLTAVQRAMPGHPRGRGSAGGFTHHAWTSAVAAAPASHGDEDRTRRKPHG